MMNMAVAGSPDEQKNYVNAALYEAFNIPETSRNFVKNPAGLVALPVTPAMNGKIWPVE